MKKKLLIIGAIVLVIIAVFFFYVTSGLSEGANVPLSGIDLSNVPDGDYTGVYEFKRWSNTVVLHVQNHRITAINIVKNVPGAQIT